MEFLSVACHRLPFDMISSDDLFRPTRREELDVCHTHRHAKQDSPRETGTPFKGCPSFFVSNPHF